MLRRASNRAGAENCYLLSATAAGSDASLVEAAVALERGNLATAERQLRGLLRARPTSIAGIRLMAMLALRLGRQEDALTLLSRALDLAPDYAPAREMRARTLQRLNRFEPALADVAALRRSDPANPSLAMLQAALFVRLGRQDDAAELYARTLADHPDSITGWLSYGHVLKATGRVPEAIAAYRRSIGLRAEFGEAWWSLANLKTVAFRADEIAAMDRALATANDADDRLHLHFALGKAHEDLAQHAQAFAHYAEGNQLRRAQTDYAAATITGHVSAMRDALMAQAFQFNPIAQTDSGPIFVVGLPRSGSTLVEQILASHPAIEGTSELPGMMMIAERLQQRADDRGVGLTTVLTELGAGERDDLAQEYRDHAAAHRHEGKPFFIDKMPNNWQNVVLIRLLLPDARIIDVRRQPMAVGWSAYKQHFARGQEFTNDLAELGQYYRDYTKLMAAFDASHPGQVQRVIYEQLVADTAGSVRALLDGLGLPFDADCLQFWANKRTVRTPSSEQVRQPVFTTALAHWRNFEPWLCPLREALGTIEEDYLEI